MSVHTVTLADALPLECRGGAVTIGNFDGVHRGHAALVARCRAEASDCGGPAVALTFHPHPAELLRPQFRQPMLTTLDDRIALLETHGADAVVVLKTTQELLHLRATEFFEGIVRARLGGRILVEGENFGFGRHREGNIDTLRGLCAAGGVKLVVLPPVRHLDEPISSSRVRGALLRGAVDEMPALLGRPYRLHGTVGVGARRGRTIGFPTANLGATATVIPANGVYAARAVLAESVWPAAVNVGPNPTFGEDARKIEVHLIGFSGDLYGRPMSVEFLARLRDTRPFGSVDELVAQLRHDVAAATRAALEPL